MIYTNKIQDLYHFDIFSQPEAIKKVLFSKLAGRPYHIDSVLNYCDNEGLFLCNKLLQDEDCIYVASRGYLEQSSIDDNYEKVFDTYEILVDKVELENYITEISQNKN